MAGILDMLSGFVRDAAPPVAAARSGYHQGQQDRKDREAAEAAQRQTALRQAMQDEREAEWHKVRMDAAQAPKAPTLESANVVNPLDGTVEDIYADGTRKVVRKATAEEIRRAKAVPGEGREPSGTWQPDPNVPGLYVHSGTGRTRQIDVPAGGQPPKGQQQRLRDHIGVVASQIDDTRSDLNIAADATYDPEEDPTVQRLRARADSLGGVRDSLAAELLGTSRGRASGGPSGSAVPMPAAPVTFDVAPEPTPRAPDNLSPLQADYDAAAAAYQRDLERGVPRAEAKRKYETMLARIAAADQRLRTGR